MKVKMVKEFRGSGISLEPGQVAEVSAALADWLVRNEKAEKVQEEKEIRNVGT